MQTFLPYKSFVKSAKVLDYRRLGKQRVEAWQILNTLEKKKLGITSIIKNNRVKKLGWLNHPAVLMWEGHEDALKEYYNICVQEWVDRGYNNSMILYKLPKKIIYPPWLGKQKFHKSHRSNLLRKDKKFYSKVFSESDDLEYFWPTIETK